MSSLTKIPESVLEIISDEQKRQSNTFIPDDPAYLEKLSRSAELLIHQDESGVLGFCFFYCNDPKKQKSYITLLCTPLRARGKGIGSALIQHVLFISRRREFCFCELEVRKANFSALKLYQQAGFTATEERGEKVLMRIKLNN